MTEIRGLANFQEAKTEEQLMMMRVWNLTVELLARAFDLSVTTYGEDAVAGEQEKGRVQGIKDTCRKVLITMRETLPFSGLYPEALASATEGETWMTDLEHRHDEAIKRVVHPDLKTPGF